MLSVGRFYIMITLCPARLCVRRVLLVGALCLPFLIVPVLGFAQSASFRSVDTNSDGVLTPDELIAAFGRAGANRLLRTTDHNGDRRITIAELRRGPIAQDGGDAATSGVSNPRDDRPAAGQGNGSGGGQNDEDDDTNDDGGDDGDDGDGDDD